MNPRVVRVANRDDKIGGGHSEMLFLDRPYGKITYENLKTAVSICVDESYGKTTIRVDLRLRSTKSLSHVLEHAVKCERRKRVPDKEGSFIWFRTCPCITIHNWSKHHVIYCRKRNHSVEKLCTIIYSAIQELKMLTGSK